MSDDRPSETLLARMKEQIDIRRENPSGSFITVTANEMKALVEGAEMLKSMHKFYSDLGESGRISDRDTTQSARWELQHDCYQTLAKLEDL